MGKIYFVGDLIFGDQPVIFGCGFDGIWNKSKYKGIFDGVKQEFGKSDVNIANLETVIAERPEKQNVNNWAMCCDDNIISILKENNITAVSIANNHSLDYGVEKYYKMVEMLEDNTIVVLGKKEKPWSVFEINGKKVAVVGATYLPVYRTENIPYLLNPTIEMWSEIIEKIGRVDKIVAYIHWGSEFVTTSTDKQKKIRDEILKAGIDDIVGHHPHIIQKNEKIENHRIIYSLGNFMSDYWQKRLRETQILVLDTDSMDYSIIPCKLDKKGVPHTIGTEQDVEYSAESEWEQNSLFLSRLRMRFEYLFHIVKCFPRMKGKKEFLVWLWKRVKYVLVNMRKEVKDPEIIYKKYER